jgi:hypothetical protein
MHVHEITHASTSDLFDGVTATARSDREWLYYVPPAKTKTLEKEIARLDL